MHPLIAHLATVLGEPDLPDKEWVNFKCPYCGLRRFGVSVKERRAWCFRCQKSPDLAKLVRDAGLPPSVLLGLDAQEGRWAGAKRRRAGRGKGERREVSLVGYERLDPSKDQGPGARRILEYLSSRHVDPRSWEVGISDDDRLVGRAVFIYREYGRPVYWQARAVLGKGIKTVNPAEGECWPRGEVLFGHDLLEEGMSLAIGEGPFDGVAMTDLSRGILGTCLLGKNISRWQVALMKKRGVNRVYVALDRDAELTAVKLACSLMDAGFPKVFVIDWRGRPWDDPSEAGPSGCRVLLDAADEEGPLNRASRVRLLSRGSRSMHERRWREKRKDFRR